MAEQNIELQGYIEKIPWQRFLDYGSVKIQVRAGKPVLVTIEKTVRLDTKLTNVKPKELRNGEI